jgi:hypothetical protein
VSDSNRRTFTDNTVIFDSQQQHLSRTLERYSSRRNYKKTRNLGEGKKNQPEMLVWGL